MNPTPEFMEATKRHRRLVDTLGMDHPEFADLLAALIEEHRPAGMTERHLIEELATIILRKRRVLLAEGAKVNEELQAHRPEEMIRYETHLDRKFEQTLAMLLKLKYLRSGFGG